MKSSLIYIRVLTALLDDICLTHPIVGVDRDKQTLCHRVEHEGLGFLTITLPKLDSAILDGLESGKFECPSCFKSKKGTALPLFLGGLLTYVFDEEGFLKQDADGEAIRHLRQISCAFKKTSLPHKQSAKKVQYEKYCQAERDMVKTNDQIRNWRINPTLSRIMHQARIIVHDLCREVDLEDLSPKNGPGSTACRSSAQEKWAFDRHLPRMFTWMFGDYLYRYNPIKEHPCLHARLVEVPKDSKGPRLISMEPREYQWVQQGLWRSLEQSMKRSYFGRNIRFRDSETNGRLALESSLSGRNATIDWSSASDRIARYLVKFLFPRQLYAAMDQASSRHVSVPWQREPVEMQKFAPMGNALCFPVESICFYALAVACIAERRNTYVERVAHSVHVFGDDTVVPSHEARWVIHWLEQLGMVHNESKTFIKGPFRESCGVDAFKGDIVTPTYFRGHFDVRRICRQFPLNKAKSNILIKMDAFADGLYTSGYWRTAEVVHAHVEEALGIYPTVSARSPLLGRKVHYGALPPARMFDVATQSPVERGFVKRSPTSGWGTAVADGYPRLLRNLIENPEEPDRFGVRDVTLKHRWAAPV